MTRFQTIGADEMERNQMMVIGIAAVILVAAVGVGWFMTSDDQEKPGSVTDSYGNVIDFDETPKQFISTTVTAAEMIADLGFRDRIVGATSDEGIYDVESKILGFDMTFDYPASIESDIAKGKVKSIGEWGSWTAESVLAAVGEGKENRETTLVIMDYNQISSDASRMTQIQNAGVTVFVLNTDSGWEIIKENYTLLGKAIGASDRAEKICNEIDDFVSDIEKATPSVSGLKVAKICYCFGSFYIYNQSEVMDVAESLGCVNALPTTQSFATVSKEAIAAADPDIIIFDDMSMGLNWEEELEKWNADPILGNLDVFKEGKAYCLEYDPMQATGYSTVHFAEGHALVASIVSAEGLGLEVPTILTDEDWKDSIKWVESKTD